MEDENKKNETPQPQIAAEPGRDHAAPKDTMKQGTEALVHAEGVVSNVYDKTAHAVNETYQHAKSYGSNNPGKSMLVVLGIGVGVGFFLGANSRRWRTGMYVRPFVHAFSDIALKFFR